jgi:hypothetical protein
VLAALMFLGQMSADSSPPIDRKFATSLTGSSVQPPQADLHLKVPVLQRSRSRNLGAGQCPTQTERGQIKKHGHGRGGVNGHRV